jgi:methyl-accepting chemotaxis protein
MIDRAIKRMKELDPAAKETFDLVDKLNVRLVELELQMMETAVRDRQEAVAIYRGEYSVLRDQLQAAVIGYVDGRVAEERRRSEELAAAAARLRNAAAAAGLAAVLASVFVARSMLRPVRALAAEAERAASGDLREGAAIEAAGDMGLFVRAFNSMRSTLRGVLGDWAAEAETLASTAGKFSANAAAVSAGASETAAAMGEVSSAMENIAAGARRIAEEAEKAAECAREGRKGLQDVVREMGEIRDASLAARETVKGFVEASRKIGEIVDAITFVADQTKLLSLNAAIEAARAGEYGRGFAVVADEVRKLAVQSAEAAKDIQRRVAEMQQESARALQSVEQSAVRAEGGARLVAEAGAGLETLIALAQELAGHVRSIASSVHEVTDAAQNVSAAAQEQTAAMEEVAAAAQELDRLAAKMRETVSRFRLS